MQDERLPVIVGVGQVNDRPADPLAGLDPVELMAAALRRAEADAGAGAGAGASLLADADYLGVVKQIAFPRIDNAAPPLAAVVEATLQVALYLAESGFEIGSRDAGLRHLSGPPRSARCRGAAAAC